MTLDKSYLEECEVYLFSITDPDCAPADSLWGLVDIINQESILLEAATLDLIAFHTYYTLPRQYAYSRLATREELRNFNYWRGHNDAGDIRTHNSR